LKSALQSAVALLSLTGGTIAAFILYYDVHDFRPYLPRIQAIYASMDPEDRNPPDNVLDFVQKADGKEWISIASGSLLFELRGGMRAGAWHYHSIMLELMLRWHLTNAQLMAFYCHYLPYEKGSGFSRAANFYFGKQPGSLTMDELATILAVGETPLRNSPKLHPDQLQDAKKRLLLNYDNGQ
jgi:hypothetical protein